MPSAAPLASSKLGSFAAPDRPQRRQCVQRPRRALQLDHAELRAVDQRDGLAQRLELAGAVAVGDGHLPAVAQLEATAGSRRLAAQRAARGELAGVAARREECQRAHERSAAPSGS